MRLASVLAIVVVSTLTACSTTVDGTPTTGVVTQSSEQGLAALLPSSDEIADILRTPPLEVDRSYEVMPEWDITATDPSCMSAIANTVTTTYDGSGYLNVFGTVLQEAGGDELSYDIDPGVVEFGSPSDAIAFVERVADQWRGCTNATVTYQQDGATRTWLVAEPDEQDGVWATVSFEQPNVWACARAIGSRSTIVADVRACGYGLTEGAAEIAHNILSRVATV